MYTNLCHSVPTNTSCVSVYMVGVDMKVWSLSMAALHNQMECEICNGTTSGNEDCHRSEILNYHHCFSINKILVIKRMEFLLE